MLGDGGQALGASGAVCGSVGRLGLKWAEMAEKIRAALKSLLKQEQGAVIREWGARFPIALVFPHLYGVAMSNLGFQAIYRLLNDTADLHCERAFLPSPQDWEEHRRTGTSVLSLESQRPLRDFAAVAFSLSYEADYPNVLKLLEAARIPLRAKDRRADDPWVLAGGVAAFLNPEPLAPFVDAFFLGEGEVGGVDFFRFLAANAPAADRRGLLWALGREVPGAYVPQGYTPRYHRGGALAGFEAVPGLPGRVAVPHVAEVACHLTHSEILSPESQWGDMFLVELGRGCPRGCRFCAAGFAYRPPRMRPMEVLLPLVQQGLTRRQKIGLMAAAASDHPHIKELCRKVLELGGELGISSLRADSADAELFHLLARGGVKTVTLAPEAGSERLRRVLNKHLPDETLAQAAVAASLAGIANLRLYFMVGLPTETLDDIREIVRLVKYLRHRAVKAGRGRQAFGQITLSLSSFVPKPWTPFQWVPFLEVAELKRRLKLVRQEAAGLKEVRLHTDLPKWAYLQALLARGDRRVGEMLLAAHEKGWPRALAESPVNPDFFVYRQRDPEELFPWDFIDHGIDKSYLWEEYQYALAGRETAPCQPEVCRRCGVCRGEAVDPQP
jgi:radical SAM superfamily enzyme YgiQ (UPF0313 family)